MLTFFFIEFRLKQYNHKQHRQVKQSIESLVEFRFSFHNPFATLSFLECIRFLLILIFAKRKTKNVELLSKLINKRKKPTWTSW